MATLLEKQNIEKARELLDRKDFVEAEEILNGLIKTRRFNDHKEVQTLSAKARKLSALHVPVVIKTKNEEIVLGKQEVVEDESRPSWWRKFF